MLYNPAGQAALRRPGYASHSGSSAESAGHRAAGTSQGACTLRRGTWLRASGAQHLSVILRLNEFGFFRVGGVLVGTHAFLAYANQLGVR